MVSLVGLKVEVVNTEHTEAVTVSRVPKDIPVVEVASQTAYKISRQTTNAQAFLYFLQQKRKASTFAALSSSDAQKNTDIGIWKWTRLPPISAQLSLAVDRLNSCMV